VVHINLKYEHSGRRVTIRPDEVKLASTSGNSARSSPPRQAPEPGTSTTAARRTFSRLARQWKSATRLLSNVTRKARHPAYQQIIEMGLAAVPLILEDLRQHPGTDWFWALTTITGENPITEEMAGDTGAMTEAWIRWGEEKGYRSGSPPRTKPSSPTSGRAITA
jgi:hypothetical protein